MLPATSAEPGPWRTSRSPYLREIMDALSTGSPFERVVLMKGAQSPEQLTAGPRDTARDRCNTDIATGSARSTSEPFPGNGRGRDCSDVCNSSPPPPRRLRRGQAPRRPESGLRPTPQSASSCCAPCCQAFGGRE
ncbi:MAG TPA: hypothetical protein DDW26_03930 [Rhizobiales bacterium]|nr:hypothetical protein [Hyphomicrobiales bacterium]